MDQQQVKLILISVFLTGVCTVVFPDVWAGLKSYWSGEELAADVVASPYQSLVLRRRSGEPTFAEDVAVATAKLPAQFDRNILRRLKERASIYDEAADTAMADCLYTVNVFNRTPRPLRSIVVTTSLLAAYDVGGGIVAVDINDDDRPKIDRLDPGATKEIRLFSRFSCSMLLDVKVFTEDGDAASVTVAGPLPPFVQFLAEKWLWVAGFFAFYLFLFFAAEQKLKKENAGMKAQLIALGVEPAGAAAPSAEAPKADKT